jgi:hypothetical protein
MVQSVCQKYLGFQWLISIYFVTALTLRMELASDVNLREVSHGCNEVDHCGEDMHEIR